MNLRNAIYTEKRECQDCYKCVRRCPVKAIKVEHGCATVIPESCILCGRCVAVCPNGAKRVRDDLPRAQQLFRLGERTVASLAPSWPAQFPGVPAANMIAALRRLGFTYVSETALGAEQVSAHAARLIQEEPDRIWLSSACPAAVTFLQRYHPDHAARLTGLLSPLLAHCRMLREALGPDVRVVFIGPCIAKKSEAERHPELLDMALTYEDLQTWLDQTGLHLTDLVPGPDDVFTPRPAEEGTLYPVDGGMIAGLRKGCAVCDPSLASLCGIESIDQGLTGLERAAPGQGLFLELLACEGGCIGGPRISSDDGIAVRRLHVLASAREATVPFPRPAVVPIEIDLRGAPPRPPPTEADIATALRSVGKVAEEDELNCAGCGYDTCRQFAAALLEGKAERAMCVTYMRKLAMKKANALLRKMPSAVFIADASLRIVEYNELFARLFAPPGSPTEVPALEGTPLPKVVPFFHLVQNVLRTGEDFLDREIRFRSNILHASIFTIEKHSFVGGIFQDVTKPSVQKEQIVRKAREVIQKNLSTVQQIAYLIGENAAESEIILDSIIESFSPTTNEEASHERPSEPGGDDWKRPYRG